VTVDGNDVDVVQAGRMKRLRWRPIAGVCSGLTIRMLCSRSDAEDVVQDAYLRFAGAQGVRNPGGLPRHVVTRLCSDRLNGKSTARNLRRPGLPEPVFMRKGLEADAATNWRTTSRSPLLALDRLSTLERADILLHDVLDKRSGRRRMLDRDDGSLPETGERARRAGAGCAPGTEATPDNHAGC